MGNEDSILNSNIDGIILPANLAIQEKKSTK
jgi:hypothetical protein